MESLKRRQHILWVTFRLRCPNCERGRIFNGLFSMNKTCPYCGVRFEREDGELVGGMYINTVIGVMLPLAGYFLVNALFHPPFVPHLTFWVIVMVLFMTFFYSRSRAMWIGMSYLTGGVYADPDEEHEYQRPPDTP